MPKRGGQRFSGIPSLAILLYFLVLKTLASNFLGLSALTMRAWHFSTRASPARAHFICTRAQTHSSQPLHSTPPLILSRIFMSDRFMSHRFSEQRLNPIFYNMNVILDPKFKTLLYLAERISSKLFDFNKYVISVPDAPFFTFLEKPLGSNFGNCFIS